MASGPVGLLWFFCFFLMSQNFNLEEVVRNIIMPLAETNLIHHIQVAFTVKPSHRAVRSCHVTYAFQIETTLFSCLNVKELLSQSGREILSLNDCAWTRTHNHLVCKRTLSNLAKLAQFGQFG